MLSLESETSNHLENIKYWAAQLYEIKQMFSVMKKRTPGSRLREELLSERLARENLKNLVKEARKEGVTPIETVKAVLKGRIEGIDRLLDKHFEYLGIEPTPFQETREVSQTKEKIQDLGYEIEKKKFPNIEMVRVSQENHPELLQDWDLFFDTPAASIHSEGKQIWTIYLNTEKIPQDLIPFVETHEFVEIIEKFNGMGRHVAEHQAIFYEYLYAQDENLLDRVHQFGLESLKKGLETEGLPKEIIEFGEWKLRTRERVFEELTSG